MEVDKQAKKLFEKFKGFLNPEGQKMADDNQSSNTRPGVLTSQAIGDELVKQLKVEIKDRSMWNHMMFPMSFNVLMCNDDYTKHKTSFPFLIEPVVEKFYEVLREQLDSKNTDYDRCCPSSNNWYIQFADCDFHNDGSGATPVSIPKGSVVITADLCAQSIGNISQSNDLSHSMSMRIVNSDLTNKFDINKDVLARVDMKSESSFSQPFDISKLGDYVVDKRAANKLSGPAELTWGMGLKYMIQDDLVDISGVADTRKQRNVLVIQGHNLQTQQVQIKHLGEGRFQIAAFQGPVLLNEVPMPISGNSDVKWQDLPNNSKIFINGSLQLTFKNNML